MKWAHSLLNITATLESLDLTGVNMFKQQLNVSLDASNES